MLGPDVVTRRLGKSLRVRSLLLNRIEYALMNNPVRAVLQRLFEARRLLRMGGAMAGGRALEVGCGRGVGIELILQLFGADTVDAFDLDPRMVEQARKRLSRYGARTRVWVGDVCAIDAPDATYDAVFDFGIIHHVSQWRRALAEVHRVIKPGGRIYAEEVLDQFIYHPAARRLLDHPMEDRFDAAAFALELERTGFHSIVTEELWGQFGWFVARRKGLPKQPRAIGGADN